MAVPPAGPLTEHGQIFKPSAPAFSSAKHCDGVSTPGQDASLRALDSMTTSASKLGETIILPPASATSRTSCALSTVPAPLVADDPNFLASRPMLFSGCGEL